MQHSRKIYTKIYREVTKMATTAPFLYYLALLLQTGLTEGSCEINNCSPAYCDGHSCMLCKDGYFKSASLSACYQCFIFCRTCDKNQCYDCAHDSCHGCKYQSCHGGCNRDTTVKCSSCPDGYYRGSGSYCYRCSHTNCKCFSNDTCNECLPGTYDTANFCQNNCPDECVTCKNPTDCTVCVPGKYGGSCELNCRTTCQDGTCNKTSGNCGQVCADNQYLDSNGNCKHCFGSRCSSCIDFSNCTTCSKSTYWGSYCQYDCLSCRGQCDKNNGCLSGCTTKYFHHYNTGKQGYECTRCPETCLSCTNSSYCIACIAGYWGATCQHNCTNCLSACNKDEGCGNHCETGYYAHAIDNGYICTECLKNCKTCSSSNTCEECKQGYFVSVDKNCEKCPLNCNNSLCNTKDGTCLEGCSPGNTGYRCDEKCPLKCLDCNQFDNSSCTGCEAGYYGYNCSSRCMNCQSSTCFQHNGTCMHGCIEGYTGLRCDEKTGSEARTQSDEKDNNDDLAIPVGAGVGAVVVIAVVVIIIVIVLRKRRSSRKTEPNEDSASLEHANDAFNKKENTYATITDSDTKEVPKNLTETDTVEKDEAVLISETPVNTPVFDKNTDKANRDLKTDEMSNDSPDPRTNSAITLEESANSTKLSIVEKDKKNRNVLSLDVSEVQENNNDIDKEANTYYNTVGKRVQVSSLAEYLRNKNYYAVVEEFNKLPRGLLKDYSVAKNPRNASKNRYKLIYPYDESRVILKDGGNDYVNASFIEGHNRTKEYIGSSGPFKRENSTNETIPDFWRMVWQERCETIVMLTKCYENGEHKCEQYWPELGKSMKFAKLKVTCVTEDEYADFTIRSFLVNKDTETLNTRHLQFTAWPDKGIPADVTSMIEYRQKVRSLHKDKTCPMIVHCSAGIGRTGTFIALDLLTFKGKAQGYVDIFTCVANLRSQRTNLVQTPEQYEYLHHAVLHALTFDCQSITAEKFIETYSKYVKKKDGKSHLETQFQNLQSTLGEMSEDEKSAKDRNGSLPDKNREGADIPGDENRIRLSGIRKPGASDYINAVFVNGFRTQNRFIVAQTPLPTTVVDFLTMICQFKCSCVVMMEETDLQDKTIGVFWPADNQVIKHGVFQVRCKESKTTQTYTIKKLSLIQREGKTETESEIDLFIFTNWPKDAAVPKSSDSLIQLINDVDKKNYHPKEARPILIHCMTGASRSCLYCTVSVLIEKLEIEHEVSVVNTVRQIKARRQSGIPTLDQYKFCHQAVISYLQTFDIYSNFGLKSSQSTETASK